VIERLRQEDHRSSGQSELHIKFSAVLGDIMRCFLKNKGKGKKHKAIYVTYYDFRKKKWNENVFPGKERKKNVKFPTIKKSL
jgi:hypothetical protein